MYVIGTFVVCQCIDPCIGAIVFKIFNFCALVLEGSNILMSFDEIPKNCNVCTCSPVMKGCWHLSLDLTFEWRLLTTIFRQKNIHG